MHNTFVCIRESSILSSCSVQHRAWKALVGWEKAVSWRWLLETSQEPDTGSALPPAPPRNFLQLWGHIASSGWRSLYRMENLKRQWFDQTRSILFCIYKKIGRQTISKLLASKSTKTILPVSLRPKSKGMNSFSHKEVGKGTTLPPGHIGALKNVTSKQRRQDAGSTKQSLPKPPLATLKRCMRTRAGRGEAPPALALPRGRQEPVGRKGKLCAYQ